MWTKCSALALRVHKTAKGADRTGTVGPPACQSDPPLTTRGASGLLFPCGLTRRELVWEMGGGFAGIALGALLSGNGFKPRTAAASEKSPQPVGPLAVKKTHFTAKAKSVIFLMMNGAPSQVDTFDYKP